MVYRMTGFIKERYPAPTLVNYRAVSNFMWIVMDDCIRIHDMLQGKFKWTKAEYEWAAVLRVQGLSFNEVAQHLSPTLSCQSVSRALREYSTPKPVREPISADELDQISRLVDEYAGKYTVVEIIDKIRTQLNFSHRRNYRSKIAWRIAAHPHYQAKLSDINYNDLGPRIATGQTTTRVAAQTLDVPPCILARRIMQLNYKLYSPKWADNEIRKLVHYMQSCDLKPDMVYFNKVLGTKSSTQYSVKIFNLRRKGVLPHVSKM
ncbi:hypothetical protein GGH93_005341 [Coemansia aciculifera]|nr:hypothetical protein GGH93_005341 [Coemansia aciculifera]